jgi:hypothetical protein
LDFYPWVKVIHIALAIVAVGFNMSYGIWQACADVRSARCSASSSA